MIGCALQYFFIFALSIDGEDAT